MSIKTKLWYIDPYVSLLLPRSRIEWPATSSGREVTPLTYMLCDIDVVTGPGFTISDEITFYFFSILFATMFDRISSYLLVAQ